MALDTRVTRLLGIEHPIIQGGMAWTATAELAAANKDLQTFASAVSHDLRAPLRAIGGFSQLLALDLSGKLNERSKICLDKVQSEVERMGRLIDALLQLSRASRGELRREPCGYGLLQGNV